MFLRLCCCSELMVQVIQNFGKSLVFGSKFIYQSMPRMLAVWLDYGTEIVTMDPGTNDVIQGGMRANLKNMNTVRGGSVFLSGP